MTAATDHPEIAELLQAGASDITRLVNLLRSGDRGHLALINELLKDEWDEDRATATLMVAVICISEGVTL